jgi:anion-transporting  ArsA/GET3 family ATPase
MMTPLAAANPPVAEEPAFLTHPAPNLFFTGKGGVGKTPCACATALRLARDGRRVLLVSTDPASNLDEVLGTPLGLTPRDIPGVPLLQAVNLDPETAAANYRESIIGPARGVLPESLIINGLLPKASDDVSFDWVDHAGESVKSMDANLAVLPSTTVHLQTAARFDRGSLPAFFDRTDDHGIPEHLDLDPIEAPGWDSLVDDLSLRNHGMIMTMGKGGVGKTIVAARLAEAIAARDIPVVLATTDPAAHLDHAVTGRQLEIIRIDAAAETAAYREEVLATAGADLDPEGRALLDEDLRSPCTEEIAVFRAFARIVSEGTRRVVICDTAPTGHTLPWTAGWLY